ncbi:Pseudouridine synthase, TruD [Carpediemonas membranifera]|uniref:Pseudouridine synthase, TruD n=1 Tax=Carpediemonas membranifera TaxID=201153 RepID=A0A8J6AXU2_9EUKA|nr:Pseudouridine synthase, TruD [Carpediemonas membranifera]|eukprot:KAG9396793.1 Pseudouridine synthase, TruD [Carpediemonas membranifera]
MSESAMASPMPLHQTRFDAPVNLADVGITSFVTQGSSFTGSVKQRYEDFCVNEIDPNGNVLHITSTDIPAGFKSNEEPFDTEDDVPVPLLQLLSEEHREKDKAAIQQYVRKEAKEVELSTSFSDKDARRTFHQTVRRCLPATESNSKGETIVLKHAKRPREAPWPDPAHKHLHFVLYKENRDTSATIKRLAMFTGTSNSFFAWAGTKDKRGVTVQRVSGFKIRPEKLLAAVAKINAEAKDEARVLVGNFSLGDQLGLGDLSGNRFDLILRDLEGDSEDIASACKSLAERGFVNYFGLQRFSTTKIPTHQVGAHLWRRDFEAALDLMMTPLESDSDTERAAKEHWLTTREMGPLPGCIGRFNGALKAILGPIKIKGYSRGSIIEGFSKLHKNDRSMFLAAYQSYVFNLATTHRLSQSKDSLIVGDLVLKDKKARNPTIVTEEDVTSSVYSISDVVLPLFGETTIFPKNATGEFMKELIAAEGIVMEECRQPFTQMGAYRGILNSASDVEWDIVSYSSPDSKLTLTERDQLEGTTLPESDEAKTRRALHISFSLASSTYATMALRELMKETVDPTRGDKRKAVATEGEKRSVE